MKFFEFAQSIVRENVKPTGVYAFIGEEEFLRSEGMGLAFKRFFGEEDPGMGEITFWGPVLESDAGELPLHRVKDELETPAFLSPQKVITVRRADVFCRLHGDSLAPLLAHLPEGTVLVLECSKLDKRKKLAKEISKIGTWVTCDKLWETRFGQTIPSADSPLGQWLIARGRKHGLRLQPDATLLLIELCGNQLAVLDDALERVALYAGEKGRADVKTIEAVVGATQDFAIFNLSAAVESNRVRRAVEILHSMIENGIPMPGGSMVRGPGVAVVVLTHLSRELEKLIIARDEVDKQKSPEQAAEAAGIRKNRMRTFTAALKQNTRAGLMRKMRTILAADIETKSGGDWRVELERTLLKLCKNEKRGKQKA